MGKHAPVRRIGPARFLAFLGGSGFLFIISCFPGFLNAVGPHAVGKAKKGTGSPERTAGKNQMKTRDAVANDGIPGRLWQEKSFLKSRSVTPERRMPRAHLMN